MELSSENGSVTSSWLPDGSRGYLRAVRWTLLLALAVMALLSLTIFTEDILFCDSLYSDPCKMAALFSALSSLTLVALALYSTLQVRTGYLLLLSVLQLFLVLYKFTSGPFQQDIVRSMVLHGAHFVVLLCGFTFACMAYCD